jgi:hypothetical protein
VCSLLVDAGLDLVGYYSSRYVPRIRQFRFMDLPLELRNIVARYALTAEKPLEFKWLQYTPSKKISTLDGLDQLTALTRVSKSLRIETMDLVWRLNDFYFPRDVASNWRIDASLRNRKIGAIEEAMRVFFHRLSTISLRKIPIQLECLTMSGHTEYLTEIENLVTSYSLLEPRAEWKVCEISWMLYCHQTGLATTYTYTRFMEKANTLRQALARFDETIQLRRWRVFPDTYPGPKEAIRHVIAAGLPEAQAWIEDGL